MGMELEAEDAQWEAELAERLSRPSTHFVNAHGGKDAVLVFDDGSTLKGKVGAASTDDTIVFNYMDDTQHEMYDVPASMFAKIGRVFVGHDVNTDLTGGLTPTGNIEAARAYKAAEVYIIGADKLESSL